MQIIGINLKDYGSAGMKITYKRYRKFNATHATGINGNEEYDLPVPANIRAEIKGLKYYILYLMKLWDDEWDKYLTDDLSVFKTQTQLNDMDDFVEEEYKEATDIFNNSHFEGYKLEKGGFTLWGDIEIIHGKTVNLKLPTIIEDDDFTLYNDCLDLIEKINEMIVNYFSKPELSIDDVKSTLKLLAGDQMKDEIDKMDDNEGYEQMIAKLEAKGGLVLVEKGSKLEKEIEKDSFGTTKIVSTKTLKEGEIDKHEEVPEYVPEDQEKKEGDVWNKDTVVDGKQQQKVETAKENDNSGDPPTDVEEF